MMKRNSISNKYLKNSSWYLLASAAQGISPLAITPILTRNITPEVFSSFILVLSIATVLSYLFAIGLPAGILREINFKRTSLFEIYNALRFYVFFLYIFALVFFIFSFFSSNYYYFVFISFSLGISLGIILLKLTIYKALFKGNLFASLALLSTFIPSLVLLFASFYTNNIFLINIYTLIVLFSSVIFGKNFFRYKSQNFKSKFNDLLKVGLPTVPHDLGMSILQYGDKIIIGTLFGLTLAGQIHLAVLIAGIPYLALSTLSNVWAPAALEKFSLHKSIGIDFLNKTTKYAASFAFILFIALNLTSASILNILAPVEYQSENLLSVLNLMSLSGVIYSIYLRNMHLLSLAGNFKSLIWITPTAIGLQLALIYVLTPHYGLISVAIANLTALASQALLTQIVTRGLFPDLVLTKLPLGLFIFGFIFYLLFNIFFE